MKRHQLQQRVFVYLFTRKDDILYPSVLNKSKEWNTKINNETGQHLPFALVLGFINNRIIK